jgi:hypothetical protein
MSELAAILWKRLDRPGMEVARLVELGSGYELSGSAVFAHEGAPVRLEYELACDDDWRTRVCTVRGWVGAQRIDHKVESEPTGGWRLDGRPAPAVAGCIDLDLNFSPSTNLLPIRRLELVIGGEARVRSAWLRFPGFALEPLDQDYRRIDGHHYAYRSATGFEATLEVGREGFVVRYPGFAETAIPVAT